jgi:hypothetical protein
MSALLLALGTLACSSPFPCNRYCWSHQQLVADVDDAGMSGTPDGRFDGICLKISNTEQWHPPLPPFGWYPAEQCVAADVHQSIARTVASIQDPTIDASQACDVTDLQVYADFVQTLALQARDACVAHLSCNGSPAGCDIDPAAIGNQACTVPTAETLCDQAVLAPALAALADLTNGPGAAQPQRDGTVIQYVDDPADCQPILQEDTDGPPACDGPAGSDEGVDESGSSGGSMLGPFGDIDALVTCTSPTKCAIEPELFAAVESNFAVFHDEGVRLESVSIPEIGKGVRLSGLDRGEASQQLLAALGLQDGDVLTHLDGASVLDPMTIEQLMLALPTTTAWSLTVRRRTGSSWETLGYTITRAP